MVPQCFLIMISYIKIPFSPITTENFSIQCTYKSCRPFLCLAVFNYSQYARIGVFTKYPVFSWVHFHTVNMLLKITSVFPLKTTDLQIFISQE